MLLLCNYVFCFQHKKSSKPVAMKLYFQMNTSLISMGVPRKEKKPHYEKYKNVTARSEGP